MTHLDFGNGLAFGKSKLPRHNVDDEPMLVVLRQVSGRCQLPVLRDVERRRDNGPEAGIRPVFVQVRRANVIHNRAINAQIGIVSRHVFDEIVNVGHRVYGGVINGPLKFRGVIVQIFNYDFDLRYAAIVRDLVLRHLAALLFGQVEVRLVVGQNVQVVLVPVFAVERFVRVDASVQFVQVKLAALASG